MCYKKNTTVRIGADSSLAEIYKDILKNVSYNDIENWRKDIPVHLRVIGYTYGVILGEIFSKGIYDGFLNGKSLKLANLIECLNNLNADNLAIDCISFFKLIKIISDPTNRIHSVDEWIKMKLEIKIHYPSILGPFEGKENSIKFLLDNYIDRFRC